MEPGTKQSEVPPSAAFRAQQDATAAAPGNVSRGESGTAAERRDFDSARCRPAVASGAIGRWLTPSEPVCRASEGDLGGVAATVPVVIDQDKFALGPAARELPEQLDRVA